MGKRLVHGICLGWGLAGVGILGVSVFGASSGGHHHKSSTPPPAAAAPAPPAASQPSAPSQLSVDEAAEVAASKDLATANKTLEDVTDALWGKFQQTPDWTAGQSKLADARASLESAKKAAVEGLANNPDYQDAVAAKQKAVDDLNAAKASNDATPETLSPLASASMMAGLKLKKVETELLSNDAGVQAASSDLTAAERGVDLLKSKFQQDESTDRDYAAARNAVSAAQQKYDEARAKVAADEGQ
jgi:hypothetical protein